MSRQLRETAQATTASARGLEPGRPFIVASVSVARMSSLNTSVKPDSATAHSSPRSDCAPHAAGRRAGVWGAAGVEGAARFRLRQGRLAHGSVLRRPGPCAGPCGGCLPPHGWAAGTAGRGVGKGRGRSAAQGDSEARGDAEAAAVCGCGARLHVVHRVEAEVGFLLVQNRAELRAARPAHMRADKAAGSGRRACVSAGGARPCSRRVGACAHGRLLCGSRAPP